MFYCGTPPPKAMRNLRMMQNSNDIISKYLAKINQNKNSPTLLPFKRPKQKECSRPSPIGRRSSPDTGETVFASAVNQGRSPIKEKS
jgi:hypothetical protein